MQNCQHTALDIYLNNSKHNPFRLRISSHNASLETIKIYQQAYILNKVSLLPFALLPDIASLYKQCLKDLIECKNLHYYKNSQFLQNLIFHLRRWQEQMHNFDSWLYTRGCFYYMQNRLKNMKRIQLMESVIYQRALIQPDKVEFIERSRNIEFHDQRLIQLRKSINSSPQKQRQNSPILQISIEAEEQQIENNWSPNDILYIDDNKSWERIIKLEQIDQETQDQIQNALRSYPYKTLQIFLKKNFHQIQDTQALISMINLRHQAYRKFMKGDCQQFILLIGSLQSIRTSSFDS